MRSHRPTGPDPDLEFRDALIAEHRQLHDLFHEIEHIDDAVRLPAMLEGLLAVLERHFEREEAPRGLYEILQERSANAAEVLALRDEHVVLLVELGALVRGTSTTDGMPQPGETDLVDAARGFSRRLRAHERRESLLLLDRLSTGRE